MSIELNENVVSMNTRFRAWGYWLHQRGPTVLGMEVDADVNVDGGEHVLGEEDVL